jgi:hypothetical protein
MPPKYVGGPRDARKMAPNTLYCSNCPYHSPHKQKMIDHVVNKHGASRKEVEKEVK